MELPDELQGCHTVILLENRVGSPTDGRAAQVLNCQSWHFVIYSEIWTSDGLPSTLRHVESELLLLAHSINFDVGNLLLDMMRWLPTTKVRIYVLSFLIPPS
jgi:hypothetical protein